MKLWPHLITTPIILLPLLWNIQNIIMYPLSMRSLYIINWITFSPATIFHKNIILSISHLINHIIYKPIVSTIEAKPELKLSEDHLLPSGSKTMRNDQINGPSTIFYPTNRFLTLTIPEPPHFPPDFLIFKQTALWKW